MAKLVVVTADNTTIDVRLDRERITIGRRPDNDVCLPYPAVSGEHAAVVTILADSFLEDLGSTNGTLVNGKPIAKHFLRNLDQIDIGKQKLVYLVNDDARYDPPPASLGPLNMRMLQERVDPVLPPVISSERPRARTPPSKEIDALSDELDQGISGMQVSAEIDSMADMPPEPVRAIPPLDAVGARGGGARRSERAATPANPDLTQSLPPVPWLKVLTGPNAGRSVPLVKDETTVGRVGVSVAVVRKSADGYLLVPVESKVPARINGRSVAEGGSPLKPGDQIEIAGAKLEFLEPTKV
jgi:pSer/pThr/pTyr-binding forkhead associated (FHA) protein